MGAGLALQFKSRFPKMYSHYLWLCANDNMHPGVPVMCDSVLCFPTKDHWKSNAQIAYVRQGLRLIPEVVPEGSSIALPKLGCGLGRLEWPTVRALISDAADMWDKHIEVVFVHGEED
jgi:hypothetical protein